MVQIAKHMLDAYINCCIGRRDDYAIQLADGRYHRVRQPVTYDAVFLHLQGIQTMGSYVIDEHGLCSFAVFDSDDPSGLADLLQLQTYLAGRGVHSYLELSRRGAHLRVFLAEPTLPALVRAWLLPFCPSGVEFYPKQDALTPDVPLGSLMRLPLGIHQLTGQRYPFVTCVDGCLTPVAASVADTLHWFTTVERVMVPVSVSSLVTSQAQPTNQHNIPFNPPSPGASVAPLTNIRAWCMQQDPLAVIGRYVELDVKGMGCCPFGWHHSDGGDTHPSLYVYYPSSSDICCWYCHTWKQGGSVFDFLRYYYCLEPRELWSHILAGSRF